MRLALKGLCKTKTIVLGGWLCVFCRDWAPLCHSFRQGTVLSKREAEIHIYSVYRHIKERNAGQEMKQGNSTLAFDNNTFLPNTLQNLTKIAESNHTFDKRCAATTLNTCKISQQRQLHICAANSMNEAVAVSNGNDVSGTSVAS